MTLSLLFGRGGISVPAPPSRPGPSLTLGMTHNACFSKSPHHSDDDSLDDDVGGRCINRWHGGVSRLQTHSFTLEVKALQSDFAVNHGDDHLAVESLLPMIDDHEVAVVNPVFDHRFAADFQHEVLATAGQLF